MPRPDPIAAHNERVKLLATSVNAVGLGVLALAAVRPLVETGAAVSLLWTAVGLAFHGVARYLLGWMRKAD